MEHFARETRMLSEKTLRGQVVQDFRDELDSTPQLAPWDSRACHASFLHQRGRADEMSRRKP